MEARLADKPNVQAELNVVLVSAKCKQDNKLAKPNVGPSICATKMSGISCLQKAARQGWCVWPAMESQHEVTAHSQQLAFAPATARVFLLSLMAS